MSYTGRHRAVQHGPQCSCNNPTRGQAYACDGRNRLTPYPPPPQPRRRTGRPMPPPKGRMPQTPPQGTAGTTMVFQSGEWSSAKPVIGLWPVHGTHVIGCVMPRDDPPNPGQPKRMSG